MNKLLPWDKIPNESFKDNCDRWRDYIMQATSPNQLTMLQREENLPFSWTPARNPENDPETKNPNNTTTILLIHGYNETAFGMRDLGKVFLQAGYKVNAMMLPGHGISPNTLADIRANGLDHSGAPRCRTKPRRWAAANCSWQLSRLRPNINSYATRANLD